MNMWLMNKYGNLRLKGFYIVNYILKEYKYPIKMMNIYENVGEKFNMTKQAIERNIRTYKNACGFKNIVNQEFISLLLTEYKEYLGEDKK